MPNVNARSGVPTNSGAPACICAPDQQSADAVVCRLFQELKSAKTQQRKISQRALAMQTERDVWAHLISYLTTLERPNSRAFDLLD